MPDVPRVGDLEIDQDLTYQRREWVFERVGWGVMLLIVLAALAGLIGKGPASDATAHAEGLRVEYERYLHYHASTALTVRVDGSETDRDEIRLGISREFLERVEVTQIAPESLRVETAGDRQVFVFRVAERGAPAAVTMRFEPDKPGSLAAEVGLDGRGAVRLEMFVYP